VIQRRGHRAAGLGSLGLLTVLTGCGYYTITFKLENVINAPTGADLPREPLAVDVVVLTAEEAEKYPEIVDKRKGADQWFKDRESGTPLGGIDPSHIYACRSGDPNKQRDNLQRTTLLSPVDGGQSTVPVRIHHPNFLSDGSAIVVYAAFKDPKGGIANKPPIVLHPPPRWKTNIEIGVGKKDIVLNQIR